MTTWWGGEAWPTVPPPKRSIRELIEASSFGDEESARLRASVSAEQVEDVMRRLQSEKRCCCHATGEPRPSQVKCTEAFYSGPEKVDHCPALCWGCLPGGPA